MSRKKLPYDEMQGVTPNTPISKFLFLKLDASSRFGLIWIVKSSSEKA